MRRVIWAVFGLVVIATLGGFLYVWYQFHTSVAVHVTPNKQTPAQFDLTVKPYSVTASDGTKIALWYVPVTKAKGVLILVHAYATENGGKSGMLDQAQFLNKAGYSTLLVDLRSFGESPGNKIYLGTKEWQDVAAAYDFAKALPENKSLKVGLLGNSMGAATVIITAGKTGKGDFIVAEAPFSNYSTLFEKQIIRENYPTTLAPIILPLLRLSAALDYGFNYDTYSPDRLISKIHVPVFIMSAKNDNWVGGEAGRKLFSLANEPKEFWQTDTSHDIFVDNPKELETTVLGFLNKYAVVNK